MERSVITAIAAVSRVAQMGKMDLHKDDLAFMTEENIWIGSEKNRAKKILEEILYSTADMLGLPRITLPAEFWAAGIYHFIHPVNWQIACLALEGLEMTEDIISGTNKDISAKQLFALVIAIDAGTLDTKSVERKFAQKVQTNETPQ